MENRVNFTLRVSWWMQFFQILFALFFTVPGLFALLSVARYPVNSLFAFLICGALAYLGLANAFSTIQITNESVTVNVFYGRFRIKWDEIGRIVMNSPFIALMGNEKRVVLSIAFAGKNKEKMLNFFQQQIEQQNIKYEENGEQFPMTHQNARVWR